MRVLIVGGYGVFGGRLARLLADEPRLTLLLAGRSEVKARALCEAIDSPATLAPWRFDRDGDLGAQLAAAAPDLVVDASGPFQTYGERPWKLVEACIARAIPYLDLADGSDFVEGISLYDKAARDADIFVISGTSTCPAITAAAVRRLTEGWRAVHAIAAGIAPTPWAGVGESVIRAIAAYAGKPVRLVRKRKAATAPGLVDTRRYVIAPPGCPPLRSAHFSLVDTPELRVLPPLWPELRDLWMGASPTPEILHRMLNGMAWLVLKGALRSLSPFAPLFHVSAKYLRWGEHRGGMFVEVVGLDGQGQAARRSWHLIAEGGDGPFIPSMAAEALIRRTLDGHRPGPGARPCTDDLELADFERAFAGKAIVTGVRDG